MLLGTRQITGPLVGRQRPLALADDLLRELAEGTGFACCWSGYAGTGKTRLLSELEARSRTLANVTLSAAARPLGVDQPGAALAEMFDGHVGALSPEQRDELFRGAVWPIRALIDPDSPPDGPPVDARAIAYALYWFLARLSAGGPVILLLDDAQWADEVSATAWDYVVGRADELAVGLFWAERPPTRSERRWPLGRGVRRQTLGPLTEAGVSELMGSLSLSGSLSLGEAMRATRGNPFLLNVLAGRERAGQSHSVAESSADWAADSVEGTVRAWVDGLIESMHPAASKVLSALAVLGSGTLAETARVARQHPSVVCEVIDQAMAAGLLRDNTTQSFSHGLVEASLRESLAPGLRDELHWRAAEEAVVRADVQQAGAHLLRCDPRRATWAGDLLERAAVEAMDRGAHVLATRLLERGLGEVLDQEVRAHLLAMLGRAELRAARGQPMTHLVEAVGTLPDGSERLQALATLTTARILAGRLDQAAPSVSKLLAQDRLPAAAAAEPDLPWALWMGERFRPGGRVLAEQVADVLRAESSPASVRRAGHGFAAIDRFISGDPREEVLHAVRAAEDVEPGLPVRHHVERSAVFAAIGVGEYAGASTTLSRSLKDLEERWSPIDRARILADQAWMEYRRGHMRSVVATATELQSTMPLEWIPQRTITTAILIEALIVTGAVQQAEALAGQLPPPVAVAETPALARLDQARAVLAQARGDAAGALHEALQRRAILDSLEAGPHIDRLVVGGCDCRRRRRAR